MSYIPYIELASTWSQHCKAHIHIAKFIRQEIVQLNCEAPAQTENFDCDANVLMINKMSCFFNPMPQG